MSKELFISKKVLEILKALAQINNGVILKEDSLYTKDTSDSGKGKGIIAEFKLHEDDISLPEEIGINDISRFLKVVNSCDSESLKCSLEGLSIKLKDKRKKLTYNSQPTNGLPEKNSKGDELFDQGETIFSFVLDDDERKQIQSDLNLVGVDNIKLQGKDGVLSLVAESTVTRDDLEVNINQTNSDLNGVVTNNDFQFVNESLFDLIVDGSYNVIIKKIIHQERTIKIMRLSNTTYTGLTYTVTFVED